MGNNKLKQHLFLIFHQRLFDTIRHNFGKRLENMIVKLETGTHNKLKQHLFLIFHQRLFDTIRYQKSSHGYEKPLWGWGKCCT